MAKIKGKITGLSGWQNNLREIYREFREFESCDDVYGNAFRLGYNSAKEAWDANPVIEGTVDPRDYRNVTTGYCQAEQDEK